MCIRHLAASLSALVLMATCAGWPVQAHTAAAPLSATTQRCPFPMPEGEVNGVTIKCGTLSVPQDRGKPAGPQVRLAYAILTSFRRNPEPDPAIHLHGGPGGSSLQFADEGVRVFALLRESRDVILFDQRGGGLSSPTLNCYNVEFDLDAVVVPALLPGISAERARMLIGCATALKQSGVDPALYNTAENVRDVLDLVRALNLQRFNLSGVSYGTRLAQEIVRLKPAGLRSVILDSSLAPSTRSYELYFSKGWRVVMNALDDCARDTACARAYPNIRARALRVLERLDRMPLQVVEGDLKYVVRGYDLMRPVMFAHDAPDVAPYLPRLFDEVERGAYDTFLKLQSGEGVDKLLPDRPDDVLQLDLASPAGQFDAAVREQIEKLDDDAQQAPRAAYYEVLGGLLGRAAMRDALRAHFSGSADELIALFAVLSDADLEDLYRANRIVRGASRELGLFKAYECHDSYPFNDPANVVRQSDSLPFDVPADVISETIATIKECAYWPTGTADARYVQPVTGDVPVLVLQGRYDFVTPTPWGSAVAAQFRSATYVELLASGHGTLKYSACARELAAAFVNQPAQRLNLACRATERREFKLP